MGSALRLRRQVSLPMSGPRTVQSEEVLKREIQLDRMSDKSSHRVPARSGAQAERSKESSQLTGARLAAMNGAH